MMTPRDFLLDSAAIVYRKAGEFEMGLSSNSYATRDGSSTSRGTSGSKTGGQLYLAR